MKQIADPGVLTNPGMGVDPDISIGPGMSVDPGALACLHPSRDCRTAATARLSIDPSACPLSGKEGGLNTLPGVRTKRRAGCCFDVRV